jgi:DNA-binding beta-propeller fold protein YncE
VNAFRLVASLLVLTGATLAASEPIKAISGDDLREPHGLAFDAHGAMYGVESVRTNRVFKLQGNHLEFISGVRWDSAPKGQEPPAPAKALDLAPALYHGPADIAVAPDGSLYVVDTFQHRLVRLDPETHAVTAFAGTGQAGFAGDGGRADRARFNILSGGVIDPTGKFLLLADLGNHRIRRIDLATQVVTTFAGNGQPGFPQDGADALQTSMDYVRSVCVGPDGTVYALLIRKDALIAIKDGKVEVVVNKAGLTGPATDGPAADARLNKPKGLTMDAKGNVLILDTENHCLRLFDPTKKTIRTIAGNGRAGSALGKDWASTQLNRPHGARVGPDGRLYVADSENNRILVGPAP